MNQIVFKRFEEVFTGQRRGLIVKFGLIEAIMVDIKQWSGDLISEIHRGSSNVDAVLLEKFAILEGVINERLGGFEERIEASDELIKSLIFRIEALELTPKAECGCGEQIIEPEKTKGCHDGSKDADPEGQVSIIIGKSCSSPVITDPNNGHLACSEESSPATKMQPLPPGVQIKYTEEELMALKESFFGKTFELCKLECPKAPDFPNMIPRLTKYIHQKDYKIWQTAYDYWVEYVDWAKQNIPPETLKDLPVKYPRQYNCLKLEGV